MLHTLNIEDYAIMLCMVGALVCLAVSFNSNTNMPYDKE